MSNGDGGGCGEPEQGGSQIKHELVCPTGQALNQPGKRCSCDAWLAVVLVMSAQKKTLRAIGRRVLHSVNTQGSTREVGLLR